MPPPRRAARSRPASVIRVRSSSAARAKAVAVAGAPRDKAAVVVKAVSLDRARKATGPPVNAKGGLRARPVAVAGIRVVAAAVRQVAGPSGSRVQAGRQPASQRRTRPSAAFGSVCPDVESSGWKGAASGRVLMLA